MRNLVAVPNLFVQGLARMSTLKSTILWKSILLMALCCLGIFGLWWWGLVHIVETQGTARAEESLAQIRQTIAREFRRAEETGNAFAAWWAEADGRLDQPEQLQRVIPFLEKGDIITNLILSRENGDSACVVRRDGEWNLILFKAGVNPKRFLMRDRRWVRGQGNEEETYQAQGRHWYQFGATHHLPSWTPQAYRYYASAVSGFTYTVPIRDEVGKLQGVVGVDVSLEELTQLVWGQRPTPGTRTMVTDSTDRLLVPPRLKGMLEPGKRYAYHLMPLSASFSKSFQNGRVSTPSGENLQLLDGNKAYVGAASPLAAKGRPQMDLFIAIPKEDLFRGHWRYAVLTFLVALLVVFGVAWVLFDFHHRVVQPVRQLAEDGPPSTDETGGMNFNSDIWELQRVGEKLHLAGRAKQERKRLLTQVEHSQRIDSVGNLAPGIVHDANNQLTVLLGQITICQTFLESTPEIQPHLLAAEEAATKCSEVLRALMDYSRPGHGHRELLDLNIIVKEAAALLRRVLGNLICIEEELAVDLPLLFGEPVRLEQILVNLGLNARDAMPNGGQLLFRTFRDGENACLEVKDTGFGMSEEVRQRIFEPFFTTKPTGKGTGLGLSMVANIVAAHGGSIHVESSLGNGTLFKIEFPPSLRKKISLAKKPSCLETTGASVRLLDPTDRRPGHG